MKMFNSFFEKYPQYKITEKPNEELISKYNNKLPSELILFWKQYGFGSFMNGFLKIINPDEYQSILNEGFENPDNEIVFAITGLGDFLLWVGDSIRLVNFRHGEYEIIETDDDMTWFFDMDLTEDDYMLDNFKNKNYEPAKQKLGELLFDECFGYEPILAAGGNEKVSNLKKVKIIEHIDIITQFVGQIS